MFRCRRRYKISIPYGSIKLIIKLIASSIEDVFQFLMVRLSSVSHGKKYTCKSNIYKCKDTYFLDKKPSNSDSMFLPEVRRTVYIQYVNRVFSICQRTFCAGFCRFLSNRRFTARCSIHFFLSQSLLYQAISRFCF
jgi:hypothetical protein